MVPCSVTSKFAATTDCAHRQDVVFACTTLIISYVHNLIGQFWKWLANSISGSLIGHGDENCQLCDLRFLLNSFDWLKLAAYAPKNFSVWWKKKSIKARAPCELQEKYSSQAFWLRSSVVSVLYSLTTTTMLKSIFVVNPIFALRWVLGSLLPHPALVSPPLHFRRLDAEVLTSPSL
jgi:hypothetical protein